MGRGWADWCGAGTVPGGRFRKNQVTSFAWRRAALTSVPEDVEATWIDVVRSKSLPFWSLTVQKRSRRRVRTDVGPVMKYILAFLLYCTVKFGSLGIPFR